MASSFYTDVALFKSPFSFENTNYENDYSIDFTTDFGDNNAAEKLPEKQSSSDPKKPTNPTANPTEEEEIPSWVDFSENTTFHGIRYIFQSGYFFRR